MVVFHPSEGHLRGNEDAPRATRWCRIVTETGLTIIGLHFQAFSIELLEWGRTFSEFGRLKMRASRDL